MAGRYDDFLGQQKKRRDLFEAMMTQSLQPKPVRNVWEGLGNLGATLTYAYMADKKAGQVEEGEKASREKYAALVGSLLGGGNKTQPVAQPMAPEPQKPPEPATTIRPLSGGMDPMQAIGGLETGNNANPQNMTSPKGAMGQFQLMPETAADIAKAKGDQYALDMLAADPLAFEQYVRDPTVNAEYGKFYFDQQTQAMAPIAQQLGLAPEVVAAAAYNAGPGRVQEAFKASGGDPQRFLAALPQETQGYLIGSAEKPGFVQMTGSAFGPGTNLTLPAAPQGALAPGAGVSPPAPAPAAAQGGIGPEQVMALLNDPATFELGSQLAMAMLEQQMAGPGKPEVVTVDGVAYQYDPSNPQGTMTPITQPQGQGKAGPFDTKALDGQAMNILLSADPATPEYAAAYGHMSQPKMSFNAAGQPVWSQPDMRAFKTPTGMGYAGGQPQAGSVLPAAGAQPAPAPGAAPQPAASPYGQPPSMTTGTGGVPPAALQDQIIAADKEVAAGRAAQEALTQALTLNDKAYSGMTAEAQTWLDRQLGGSESGTATTQLTAIMTEQALSQLRAIFGGNPTEGERKILLDIQAAPSMSKDERRALIDRAMVLVQQRLESATQKAQGLRDGTYFQTAPQAPQQDGVKKYNPATGLIE